MGTSLALGEIHAMALNFVYALLDPRTDQIRYVGVATPLKRQKGKADPHVRYLQHIWESRYGRNHHRHRWIRKLLQSGLLPRLTILQHLLTADAALAAERKWIALLKARGFRLTNMTDGGEAPSSEVRVKIGAAQTGKNVSAETRAKLSAVLKGRKRSPETCATISASQKGKKLSPEHRAKIGAAQKGRPGKPHSAESRARMSASHIGKKRQPHSAETRAKIGAGIKHHHQERRAAQIWPQTAGSHY